MTGTFRYADTAGLRPISYATVEVWRFAPRTLGIWGWGRDATLTTSVNGTVCTTFGFEQGVVYALRVVATNYAAVVWPDDAVHTEPFRQAPGEPDGAPIQYTATSWGQAMDFSYSFTNAWSAQHFNLAETVRRGRDFVPPAATRRKPIPYRPPPYSRPASPSPGTTRQRTPW